MIQIWLSQSGTTVRLSNWSTKKSCNPWDIPSYFRPGVLCRNLALVGRKLQIEGKYDMVMINLLRRSLEKQAAPANPAQIGSKPFWEFRNGLTCRTGRVYKRTVERNIILRRESVILSNFDLKRS